MTQSDEGSPETAEPTTDWVLVGPATPEQKVVEESPTKRHDVDRSRILMAYVAVLVLLPVSGIAGWFVHLDMKEWVAFTAPLWTLLGSVTTFYFTSSRDR